LRRPHNDAVIATPTAASAICTISSIHDVVRGDVPVEVMDDRPATVAPDG
jgi:hypothetical protein